ncbi:hypothetical protein [Actinoplanes regularis]|uniref:Quinol monooxygenase YgiN n=1 Tax=Actinoplanes regularis TaxID=52697 RepID=A0A239JSG8_9ACTN|nr:hypothetical protein [Actinoplanes regularis]GIE92164.1 hypothetical protein Are01nite_86440 [Actinoplanes regularis]GLW35610.1 hypothetical protein Areg01_85450 [Actinoplanes regularis]SNT08408.1 hypothetical protein SAMN06264365_13736 [Actinoplanes regularis]
MSVIIVMRFQADPTALEQFANANAELMEGISSAGQAAGAIRHSFAAGEGEVIVIDEWPDEVTFQKFFESQPDIPKVMQAAGVQSAPEISSYRKIDAPGEF